MARDSIGVADVSGAAATGRGGCREPSNRTERHSTAKRRGCSEPGNRAGHRNPAGHSTPAVHDPEDQPVPSESTDVASHRMTAPIPT